jgi:SAM-dependent methyltransferase
MRNMRFEDIDWNRLRQFEQRKKNRQNKTAEDWDRKAAGFAKRNEGSMYNQKFIDLLRPEPSWTILDVGSGPGTLAIPLARHVRHVTALDFSSGMLGALAQKARELEISNISLRKLSWSDDWRRLAVAQHDIVLASRSLSVPDLKAALEKLSAFARREVVVTDRVGPGPFDPDAFQAVGRKLESGPDYIFTINILYQMGFLASVDFIRLENSLRYHSFDEAVENFIWMFPDPTPQERRMLEEYVRSIATRENDGIIILHPRHVTTWAFIRWNPGLRRP